MIRIRRILYCLLFTFTTWRYGISQIMVPNNCGDAIYNYLYNRLTEYPTDPDFNLVDGLNFLNFGDKCNAIAQVNFRAELKLKYQELVDPITSHLRNTTTKNLTLTDVWDELDIIWNKWRTNTVSGESGNRVCNPRRLLGCHETLRKCLCLQDFVTGRPGDPEYNTDHEVILARPIKSKEITQNVEVERTVCKAVIGSACDWKIPYLRFCQIPCFDGEDCVGQAGTRERKICRNCNTSLGCQTDEKAYIIPVFGTAIRKKFAPQIVFMDAFLAIGIVKIFS